MPGGSQVWELHLPESHRRAANVCQHDAKKERIPPSHGPPMETTSNAEDQPFTFDTRTGKLVEQLVEAVQTDLDEAIVDLERGLTILEAMVADTKGVNGLSSFLKAQGNQLEKMIGDIRDESEAVARKMFGTSRPEIVQRVNLEKVEELREAV